MKSHSTSSSSVEATRPSSDHSSASLDSKDDHIYYVPVRGLENFHKVNSYAEFLDLKTIATINAEEKVIRDGLVSGSNPSLSSLDSDSSPAKKPRVATVDKRNIRIVHQPLTTLSSTAISETRIFAPTAPGQTRVVPVKVVPIRPKSSQANNVTTIVLPPRPPQGNTMQ